MGSRGYEPEKKWPPLTSPRSTKTRATDAKTLGLRQQANAHSWTISGARFPNPQVWRHREMVFTWSAWACLLPLESKDFQTSLPFHSKLESAKICTAWKAALTDLVLDVHCLSHMDVFCGVGTLSRLSRDIYTHTTAQPPRYSGQALFQGHNHIDAFMLSERLETTNASGGSRNRIHSCSVCAGKHTARVFERT